MSTSSYQKLKWERDLNGECIMLMREHLASVGIEAAFADDVAAIAAHEIRRLRRELAMREFFEANLLP